MCRYPTFDYLQMCQHFIIERKRLHTTEIYHTTKKADTAVHFFLLSLKLNILMAEKYSYDKQQHAELDLYFFNIKITTNKIKINKSITLRKSITRICDTLHHALADHRKHELRLETNLLTFSQRAVNSSTVSNT